ncbi:hypothetical protein N7468_002830 [Penicillium chermesinum]|uniref:DUF3074 domain-containing protein n=1 Tax=Penicillium chermesinum TaxID=63820 RepID=A0A9W9PKP9_9EURO|nr:uncharacterized protein N7468_002830 [Penicillium chermesinum]KAJ5247847.1 hypothetical protein N7468_002830 [Penicillium chermesinum]KAJ6151608.1 hypothetical protein N7470_007205 [Penicillium chermesinum]
MPLIQLKPHLFTSLPQHPSFADNDTRTKIQDVTRDALHEALEFLHSVPSAFTADPKLRASSPSAAKVKLSRRWRKQSELEPNANDKAKPEFWVCRQSEHLDSNTDGTASWDEFQQGLRVNHAEHEMEYTPSVTGVERLLEWPRGEIADLEINGIKFHDVDAEGRYLDKTSSHPYISNLQ